MAEFAVNDQVRALVWAHLAAYPGLTAHEIQRAALRGRTGNSTLALCRRMERAGQLTGRKEYRAQQGREVFTWHVIPGSLSLP